MLSDAFRVSCTCKSTGKFSSNWSSENCRRKSLVPGENYSLFKNAQKRKFVSIKFTWRKRHFNLDYAEKYAMIQCVCNRSCLGSAGKYTRIFEWNTRNSVETVSQNTAYKSLRKICRQVKSEIRLCLETVLNNHLSCLRDKCAICISLDS